MEVKPYGLSTSIYHQVRSTLWGFAIELGQVITAYRLCNVQYKLEIAFLITIQVDSPIIYGVLVPFLHVFSVFLHAVFSSAIFTINDRLTCQDILG